MCKVDFFQNCDKISIKDNLFSKRSALTTLSKTEVYMPDIHEKNIYRFTDAENSRFRKIILDVMMNACDPDADANDGIGTLGEKQMHAAIKRFICNDSSKHEVKIQNSEYYIGVEDKKRKFVADILDGNVIYEIQTGSFAPLTQKIRWILDNTSYNVSLIHPMPQELYIRYIENDGSISSRRRSPRSQSLKSIIPELYYIKDFLNSDRFSLTLVMMEAEQYRKRSNGKRKKTTKYETIPSSLICAHLFGCSSDYTVFMPNDLPSEFTVRQFSQKSGIYGLDAYSYIKLMCELGYAEECGMSGRAKCYRKLI